MTINQNKLEMDNELDAIVFKVIIIGDPNTGKTTVWDVLNVNDNDKSSLKSISAQFYYNTEVVDLTLYKGGIWDLSEPYQQNDIPEKYVVGSWGAIFCFDTTKKSTLLSLENWILTMQKHLQTKNIPILVLGMKNDLIDKTDAEYVSSEMLNQHIEEIKSQFANQPTIIPKITDKNHSSDIFEAFRELRKLVYNTFIQ